MRSPEPDPVHKAVMRNSWAEVIQAIAQGVDVDALDRAGRTPLFYAAADGDSAIAAELIRHGANANARDKNLETPPHAAARSYRPEVVELLLKNGAGVNAQDAHGNTPLSRAVFDSKGRGQVIKLLLSSGADTQIRL